MEKSKYDWNTFVARRRVNVSLWMEKHGIKSYKALVSKCGAIGIVPPNEASMSSYFETKKQKPKSVVVEEPVAEPVVEKPSELVVSDTIEEEKAEAPVEAKKSKKFKSSSQK